MSKLHAFSNNVKSVLRDMAETDFKSTGYNLYLAVCAARAGVSVQPNKSGEGSGMKGETAWRKANDIPTQRKGNLSKSLWVVWTLIPHVVDADDSEVRDIVEAFVGDRSLDDLVAESNEVRGIVKDAAVDSLDKIVANATVRAEALGFVVIVDRWDDGRVTLVFA